MQPDRFGPQCAINKHGPTEIGPIAHELSKQAMFWVETRGQSNRKTKNAEKQSISFVRQHLFD
jgi:hypothetical protein